MNTKRIITALVLTGMLALPAVVNAEKPDRTEREDKNFCTRFTVKSADLEVKLAEHKAKLVRAQDERDTKIDQKRADRDARLAKKRAEADAHFPEKLAQLKAAVAARRTAVDAAMKAFRDGVNQLVTAHQNSVAAAAAAYKTAVDATTAKAKSDCDAGVTPATVRTNFMAAMKAARDKLRADRKTIDKIGPQVEALAKTRNAAVKKAMEDFKAALEKARADLKAALATPTPTATP